MKRSSDFTCDATVKKVKAVNSAGYLVWVRLPKTKRIHEILFQNCRLEVPTVAFNMSLFSIAMDRASGKEPTSGYCKVADRPWYELATKRVYPYNQYDIMCRLHEALVESSPDVPVDIRQVEHPYGSRWRTHGQCMWCKADASVTPTYSKYHTFHLKFRVTKDLFFVICCNCIGQPDVRLRRKVEEFYHPHDVSRGVSQHQIHSFVRNLTDRTK